MKTPEAAIIKLNPDCSGTHIIQSELDELTDRLAELECAKSALIEVLKMAVPQTGKKSQIMKTEGGEEIDCLLIPKDEVESVLERYG